MPDNVKTRPFVEQRRKKILEIIQQDGRASVSDLADRLAISALTVRRDLDWLEAEGLVIRRYGEAVLAGDAAAGDTRGLFEDQKDAIARAAAAMVHDNDVVFINTSSTALMIVPYITARGVTVITNSLKSQELPVPPDGMLLCTGGEVRNPRGVLSGEFALNNVRSAAAMFCFVGCAGCSIPAGVTSTTQQEAMVNSLMVERSEKFVLLADSSKLGVGAGFCYADLDQISLLITDEGASDAEVEELKEAGIQDIQRV